MRLMFLLLLPAIALAQRDTIITYHTKEVHTINWVNNDSSKTWKVDTITYLTPAELKLTKKSIVIDGYGSFKVDSVRTPEQSLYWRYYLPGGVIFSWIEKYAYLTYPIVNKKSKILVFYVD